MDSNITAGNCYQYELLITNYTGLVTTYTSSAAVKVTAASPIALSPGASSGAYLSAGTLWLGNTGGTFKLQLTVTGQTGVTSAAWADNGTSGSLTGTQPASTSTSPFQSAAYAWATGGGINTSIALTRNPGATSDSVTVMSDTTAPSASISYADGLYGSSSVAVSASATDTQSGVATTQVQRRSTTFTGSTCDTSHWGPFSNVTLVGGNDTTVTGGNCYQYIYTVTDNVGNSSTATSSSVAEIPDTTPPTFVSGSVDLSGANTQLTINMSEALDCTAILNNTTTAGAFAVTFNNGAEPSPTTVVGCSGSSIVLSLPTSPNNGESVKVSYTEPGGSGDRVKDQAVPNENATASFGPVTVLNNVPDSVPPVVTSASINATQLTLTFDEALDATNAPGGGAFTVTADGNQISGHERRHQRLDRDADARQRRDEQPGDRGRLRRPGAQRAARHARLEPQPDGERRRQQRRGVQPRGHEPDADRAGLQSNPPPIVAAPALLSSSPDDGSTIAAVSTVTLTANEFVNWRNMNITKPDGSVVQMSDQSGQTAGWSFPNTAEGLYVIRGTITIGGQSFSILTHFTIFIPPPPPPGGGPSLTPTPAVQKNATPAIAGFVTTSDGLTTFSWPKGTFGDAVVVQVQPQPPSAVQTLPSNSLVVDVTAFLRSNHSAVTVLGEVADVQFKLAPLGATPLTSQDAKTWQPIQQLQSLNLPASLNTGWFRDSADTVHVLTRHLTLYALVLPQLNTKLAIHILTARRLWLSNRSFISVRITITAPARLTGWFVSPSGTTVPAISKGPVRRAGATVLRLPLVIPTPGLYKLQLHAVGNGQTANRTAKIMFVERQPAKPLITGKPIGVVVIRGVHPYPGLDSLLGSNFNVWRVADANLYDAVNPGGQPRATKTAALVVNLDGVPLYTISQLHALLPELQIVGVTKWPQTVKWAQIVGVHVLLRPVIPRSRRSAPS